MEVFFYCIDADQQPILFYLRYCLSIINHGEQLDYGRTLGLLRASSSTVNCNATRFTHLRQ